MGHFGVGTQPPSLILCSADIFVDTGQSNFLVGALMPLYTLPELIQHENLRAMADRLMRLSPGLLLTTGQGASGKLTTLMALAHAFGNAGQSVTVLTDRMEDFEALRPHPDEWKELHVEPTTKAWNAAMETSAASGASLLLVSPLSRVSAGAVLAAAPSRWVLATVDTPLIGLDVAYALYEMGISNETFIETVRGVWSQLLVRKLCTNCAVPTQLSPVEMDYLFPASPLLDNPRIEVGCPACDGLGTNYRDAICDVLLIDDITRPAVKSALLDGTPLRLAPEQHVTAQDQARMLVVEGIVGVGTYRDAIRRNPLLSAQNMIEREQSRSFKLGNLFDKFVSPEVKRRLLESESVNAVINGEARDVSCLFCDIRNFTSRAEARDPEMLFAELNRYFAEVVDAVLENEGTIDKFIGDAVMVVFGAPLEQSRHAQQAVECALSIRQRIDAFNLVESADLPIAVGMGINSGRVIAGCIGTDKRMEYTVLGDTVNIAARLESRASPGQILISNATRQSLSESFTLRAVGSLELKGKSERVEAFEVLN